MQHGYAQQALEGERDDTGCKSKPITALGYCFLGVSQVAAESGENMAVKKKNRLGGGSK